MTAVVMNERLAQIREIEGTRAEQVEEEISRVAILGVYDWLAVVLVNEQIAASGQDGDARAWRSQTVTIHRILEGAEARYGRDGVSRETVLVGLKALADVGVVSLTGTTVPYAQWTAEWKP